MTARDPAAVASRLLSLRVARERRDLRRELELLRDSAQACLDALDRDEPDVSNASYLATIAKMIDWTVVTISTTERAMRDLVAVSHDIASEKGATR
jgi:hypothetical protein